MRRKSVDDIETMKNIDLNMDIMSNTIREEDSMISTY